MDTIKFHFNYSNIVSLFTKHICLCVSSADGLIKTQYLYQQQMP